MSGFGLIFLIICAAGILPIKAFSKIPSTRVGGRARLEVRMAGSDLRGDSLDALVAPVKADKNVDYEALINVLKRHMVGGTDGAVVLGTAGEAAAIGLEDRSGIIRTAVQTVGRAFLPIIVGTGAISAEEVIAMCKNANETGADASLVLSHYGIKSLQRSLSEHCWDNDDTGCRFTTPPVGGDGVVSVTANVATAGAKMHEMSATLPKAGGHSEAEAINIAADLELLHSRLSMESSRPSPVKKAVSMAGKCGPAARQALAELDISMEGALSEAIVKGNCLEPVLDED
jgi:dihydrodipicolinate synthase/N-acetylneuraminate lyase